VGFGSMVCAFVEFFHVRVAWVGVGMGIAWCGALAPLFAAVAVRGWWLARYAVMSARNIDTMARCDLAHCCSCKLYACGWVCTCKLH
jgi:hypothetical protein